MPERVLFVCIHNSARSQMAEALLNRNCEGAFIAESAGLQPGNLNPVVVEVLRERGIEIAGKRPRSVAEALRSGVQFDYVITVCDEGSAAGCPAVPGAKQKLHWSFQILPRSPAHPKNASLAHERSATKSKNASTNGARR